MQRICLFFLLIVFSSCENRIEFDESDPVFNTGDSLVWKQQSYIDSGWRKERGNTGDKIFWMRFKPVIKSLTTPNRRIGVEVFSFGGFDVYWDGVFIGSNGKPALDGEMEIPGTHGSIFLLPDTLSAQGEHLLALRATQVYRSGEQRGGGYKIDEYDALLKWPLIISSLMNLMAGGFLVVAVYYFFLFGKSAVKNKATLVFALTCLLCFALLIAEYCKFYIDIPYTYFYFRLEIIGFLTIATAILIPLYFCIQFNFKAKRVLMYVLCVALTVVYFYNLKSYDFSAKLFSGCMWIASVFVVINGILRKEKGALIVLFALLLSLALNFFVVYDFGIFFCFFTIVISMLYLHAIRAREDELAHQSALLQSSRLKLELLKKNIQPHFIKNTLTSLIDWVEESPKQGIVFIQALSAEFDIMNEISDQTLIPIAKEIGLCKAHLAIMGFRKEISYHWEEKNINPQDEIPPAIIHTLLENGITHSLPLEDGSINFSLSFESNNQFKMYTFLSNAKNRNKSSTTKKSTGFAYIVARLTESYGDCWKFDSREVAEGWCSQIKIFTK